MEQNNNGFNPFPMNQSGAAVPPPPASDTQVGIRTMQSDIESVRQSGGGMPEAQIFSAADVSPAQPAFQQQPAMAADQYSASSAQPQQTTFAPFGAPTAAPVADAGMSAAASAPTAPTHSSFGAKTLFIVLGIIVLAVAVGFGVFYLVSSLKAPAPVATPDQQGSLPVVPVQESPFELPTTTPLESPSSTGVTAATHTSLFSQKDQVISLSLSSVSAGDVRSAIKESSDKNKVLAARVYELVLADGQGVPLSSRVLLGAYLPSIVDQAGMIVEGDPTVWLYGDKTGGNKLGMVFAVKEGVSPAQVQAALKPLESAVADVAQLFLSSVAVPQKPEFKEAAIQNIAVRYLAFSVKNQQVFEYAIAQSGGKTYVVITSSYGQMVDVIKRMSLLAAGTPQPSLTPALSTSSTSTPTSTQ